MRNSKVQGIILEDRGLVALSGSEARPFLQGLITNDIDRLDEDHAIYAALLTPQGKFLHDFVVMQWDSGLLIDTDATRVPDLLRRLTMYRMRAKVAIDDWTQRIRVAAVIGGDRLSDGNDAKCVRDPRHRELGWRVYASGDIEEWLTRHDIALAPADTYERLRIKLGIPAGHRDIPVEKAFPLEYGFGGLNAVSYSKGCYVGQELTARTHNRGKVKKALYRVRFEGTAPAPGTEIRAGDDSVGEILSGFGDTALAHLRIDASADVRQLRAGEIPVAEAIAAPVAEG
jgi:folate-binding protein YgfZ